MLIYNNSGCHYESNSYGCYCFNWIYMLHPALATGFLVLLCQYTFQMLQLPFVWRQMQEFLTFRLFMIEYLGDSILVVLVDLAYLQETVIGWVPEKYDIDEANILGAVKKVYEKEYVFIINQSLIYRIFATKKAVAPYSLGPFKELSTL